MRVGLARRPSGAGALDPAGLLHPAGGRRDLLRGGAAGRRRPGWSSSRSWSRTRSCRSPSRDPRVAAVAAASRSRPSEHIANGASGLLVHRTKASGLRMAAAMDHVVDGPEDIQVDTDAQPDWARTTIACVLQPGQRLRVVKLVAYGWSSQRSLPALRDQVDAALAARAVRRLGGAAAPSSGRTWTSSGTPPTSRWTATPRCSRRCGSACSTCCRRAPGPSSGRSPAKGLTGPGYDGHVFWDTEMFVLPVLTYTQPRGGGGRAALAALHARPGPGARRHARAGGRGLPLAHDPRPGVLGLLAGRHRRVPHQRRHRRRRHAVRATPPATRRSSASAGWSCWSRPPGCGARWATTTGTAGFHIDGVTGPDEYTALADDNIYTNLMAQRNLLAAADAAAGYPDVGRGLGVDDEEAAAWRDAADGHAHPVRRGAGRAPAGARASPATRSGTSPPPARSTTRCCCTPRTSTSTASRWSSRPTWCSPCTGAATPSPTSRRPATSPTTSRARSGTPRCRRAPRR